MITRAYGARDNDYSLQNMVLQEVPTTEKSVAEKRALLDRFTPVLRDVAESLMLSHENDGYIHYGINLQNIMISIGAANGAISVSLRNGYVGQKDGINPRSHQNN